MSKLVAENCSGLLFARPTHFRHTGRVEEDSAPWQFYLLEAVLAKNGSLEIGDLVTHISRSDDLFIVIEFTYRVSRWGNRRLAKVFCSTTGGQEFILEEQLVMINSANSEKTS